VREEGGYSQTLLEIEINRESVIEGKPFSLFVGRTKRKQLRKVTSEGHDMICMITKLVIWGGGGRGSLRRGDLKVGKKETHPGRRANDL
jgi:hypothetical protein